MPSRLFWLFGLWLTVLFAKRAGNGTTLGNSAIATSHLLRKVTYPDSSSDNATYAYDRQAERTTLTDPSGSVHSHEIRQAGAVVARSGDDVGNGSRRCDQANHVRLSRSWNGVDDYEL